VNYLVLAFFSKAYAFAEENLIKIFDKTRHFSALKKAYLC
jgi:hypothetical protein